MGNKKVEEAVKYFFEGNLGKTQQLHNVNDLRKLYNIALTAARENAGVPKEEMRESYRKALESENLAKEVFDVHFEEYMEALNRSYDILLRLVDANQISEDFKF